MNIVSRHFKSTWRVFFITLLGVVLCLWQTTIPGAWGCDDDHPEARFKDGAICSATATAALKACRHEVRNQFWTAIGACSNLADESARIDCTEAARATFRENNSLCRDQYDARLEICDALGEAAYDPELDPNLFVDFGAVIGGASFTPNLYYPLAPGTERIYVVRDDQGHKLERIKTEVLAKAKEIQGISCIMVRDRVWKIDEESERSLIIEDTQDWYAQDLQGNVWYMGELAMNFEDGELIDVSGSWKAGRDLAKAGLIMPANPEDGMWYRQEFFLGEAEDMAEVVGIQDKVTVRGKTYHDVLQTRDFTPITPGSIEYKYYAPGIGAILEINPVEGERMELVRFRTH